jgi:chromosome segregation ATPase
MRDEAAPDQLYVEYECFKTRQAKWKADLSAKGEEVKDLTKELKGATNELNALRTEFDAFRQEMKAFQVS